MRFRLRVKELTKRTPTGTTRRIREQPVWEILDWRLNSNGSLVADIRICGPHGEVRTVFAEQLRIEPPR